MLLVPAGALTRITTAPEVVVGAAAEEYELVDLRRDILLHCHDNDGHSCLGETIAAVRSLAYWPDLVKPPGSKASAAAHNYGGVCILHCQAGSVGGARAWDRYSSANESATVGSFGFDR